MTLTMIVLFAIGVPVAGWLVALAVEWFARREEQRIETPRHPHDPVSFWTFAILNQIVLILSEWQSMSWRFWFLACLLLFSLTAAAIEVRKKTRTPG